MFGVPSRCRDEIADNLQATVVKPSIAYAALNGGPVCCKLVGPEARVVSLVVVDPELHGSRRLLKPTQVEDDKAGVRGGPVVQAIVDDAGTAAVQPTAVDDKLSVWDEVGVRHGSKILVDRQRCARNPHSCHTRSTNLFAWRRATTLVFLLLRRAIFFEIDTPL